MRHARPSRYKVHPSADPIVHRLFNELIAQRAALTDVAERAGVQPRTVSAWANTNAPTLYNLRAVLNVLGLDLYVGTIRTTRQHRGDQAQQGADEGA